MVWEGGKVAEFGELNPTAGPTLINHGRAKNEPEGLCGVAWWRKMLKTATIDENIRPTRFNTG